MSRRVLRCFPTWFSEVACFPCEVYTLRRWQRGSLQQPVRRCAEKRLCFCPSGRERYSRPMSKTSPGTALVVVDVQNDFADPEGSLYVQGAEKVVEEVNALIRAAAERDWAVFYTQDWHPETTPHFAKDGGVWPVHCVAGTFGADFHPDLIVDGPSVRKGTGGEDGYSGFTTRDAEGVERPTALDGLLRQANIGKVVVVGLALDYCVKDTALDAALLGYETEVPLDATAAVNITPGDGPRAINLLSEAGIGVVS